MPTQLEQSSSAAFQLYRQEVAATHDAARLCIECGDIDTKLFAATAMYGHAYRATAWEQRCYEIGVTVAPATLFADRAVETYTSVSTALSSYLHRVANLHALTAGPLATDPVSDAPTHLLRDHFGPELQQLETELRALASTSSDAYSAGHFENKKTYHPPRRPSREAYFLRISTPVAPAPPSDHRAIARQILHTNLTDLELATIEICALFVLKSPAMPTRFLVDMSRQAWDEARHAKAFLDRFLELGGELGERPTNFSNWDIVADCPLALGLTCHQAIGEWIGIDGALWLGEFFRRVGDEKTARIFDYVAQDELTHVRFGTKWIEALLPEVGDRKAFHAQALERRRDHGKVVDGALQFPLHQWACEAAGMDDFAINELVQRYEEHGSVRAPNEAITAIRRSETASNICKNRVNV